MRFEMKKIFYALCALSILTISSCSEDFVTPEHNGSEPMSEYFNTEARMFQGLTAAYDPLEWYDYFYQYDALHLVYDIMGDDINAGGSNEGDQPVLVKTHFYTATSTDVCNQMWTISYSGINRCCVFLENVDNVSGMSDETKALYKAEAIVLKAFYYNVLWKLWGNVPYYDENLTSPYVTEQLDHDDVYEKIVTNLEDVFEMNVLPMKASAGNEGRVTLAMAYMLYTEAVMYQNDESRYQKALDFMKEIKTSGKYSLVDDFAGIWTEAGEWCSESIWEINYISEGGVRSWDAPIATGGNIFSVLTGIPSLKNSSDFVEGWGFGTVRKAAYDMYDETDIRRDGGILNFAKYAEESGASYTGRWEDTGYFLLKYIARANGNHGYLGDPNMNHGNNERVYRYAETLLNAAELSVLLGQDPSGYLKEIRDRAKCQDTGLSREDIIQERHKEFVGEGKRYWDLVRSGMAASVLKASNHEYRQNDWSESKKYWPIPQTELDKDPTLVQNNY